MIGRIEQAATAALPALERAELNGWLAQASGDVIRRIDSVATFGHLPADPARAVEQVETWYRARGQPARFRLTPLDGSLDLLLDELGYERSGRPVAVMTRPVTEQPGEPETADWDEWLASLGAFTGQPAPRLAALKRSLASLTSPVLPVLRRADQTAVATGLAVVDGEHAGMFDVSVAPARRRRGHARAVMHDLLRWAAHRGAGLSYLQVDTGNRPALRLYEELGFSETYRYWYRTSP